MERDKLGRFIKGYKSDKKGKKLPSHTCEKMRIKMLEKWKDKNYRKMQSNSHKGYKPKEETIKKLRDNHLGEKNKEWKGDNVGYNALHNWVKRHKGKPKKCEHCGSEEKRRYHWANVDHKYKRNLDDYIRLCQSCHWKYDIKNNNRRTMTENIIGKNNRWERLKKANNQFKLTL